MHRNPDCLQHFGDRDILRAGTVPAKPRIAPEAPKWPPERREVVSVTLTLEIDSDAAERLLGASPSIEATLADLGGLALDDLRQDLRALGIEAEAVSSIARVWEGGCRG